MPLEIGEPQEHVVEAARLDLGEHLLALRRIRRCAVLALHVCHPFLLVIESRNAKSLGGHERCGYRGCVASNAGGSLQGRRTEPVNVLQRSRERLAGGETRADTGCDAPAASSTGTFSGTAPRRLPDGA